MTPAEQYRVVLVTVDSEELARTMSQSLVKEGLAACVNRIPGIQSVYAWQGKIETDEERLLIIKTRKNLLEALEKRILELHTYDTPEILSFEISEGTKGYLEWISASTNSD